MATPDFDVIVVGAGIAGSTCALLCARAGMSVLLLERGEQPGVKNMSGGRLYGYALETILPGFASHAPLERRIAREKLSLLTPDSATTVEYQHPAFASPSWSVLRSRFDPWLMGQAEAAGAQCLTGVLVERLVIEAGKVCGVIVDNEPLTANTVVLAEGANTLLCEQHGLAPKAQIQNMAIGVKEVLALPREILENRFCLDAKEGVAWLFSGEICGSRPAGGFLYTNRDTLSVGIVCPLSSLGKGPAPLPQLLDSFKKHPALRPLLRQTELLEYGAHMVPEGGLKSVPGTLAGNGWMIVGDSAGFCVNTGLTIRGMDLAMLSARAAAEVLSSGTDDLALAYSRQLKQSALWATLSRYQHFPAMMHSTPALFSHYPKLFADLQREHYETGLTPPDYLVKRLWHHARRHGLLAVVKDILQGAKSL